MKLKNQVVIHRIYGEGVIAEVVNRGVNNYISVNFIREKKEFAFPGIFETAYMRFKDDRVQATFKEEYGIKSNNLGQVKIENPDEKYVKEYNSIRQLRVVATRPAYAIRGRLTADLFTYYGGAAQPIYIECCKQLGWDSYASGNFGRQKKLFAQNATPEGYDVWFMCHSNYTDDVRNNAFINKISDDLEYIYEKWTDNSMNMDGTMRRVVFVRTTNGKYVFLGVYENKKVVRVDDGSRLRVFKRVSETYPEGD